MIAGSLALVYKAYKGYLAQNFASAKVVIFWQTTEKLRSTAFIAQFVLET